MSEFIKVRGAKEHNLKNINVDIPKNKLVVITGLSGSGKSSLAFDTIYAEGQRRYVESLSSYARQFLQLQNKPDVESIEGLSPAIAIDQKTTSKNPRSTVGTITEIYDYLRLLYARIGVPYSPTTGLPIESQSASTIVGKISDFPEGTKIYILAPIAKGEKGEFKKELLNIRKQGFVRIKLDNEIIELDDIPKLDKNKKHNIEVIVDRIVVGPELGNRLADSIETALKLGNGFIYVEIVDLPESATTNISKLKKEDIIPFSEKFACPVSGFQIDEIEPRIFSFNSPYGACKECNGLGSEEYIEPDYVVPNKELSLRQGAIIAWDLQHNKLTSSVLQSLAIHYDFSLDIPFNKLSNDIKNVIFYGSGEQEIKITIDDGIRKKVINEKFDGIINYLERQISQARDYWEKAEFMKYINTRHCSSCNGYRLKKESLCIKIADHNIGQVCEKSIENCYNWFSSLTTKLSATHNKIAERVLKEITDRLSFLRNVGLDYLTIARESGTLSGGESQRIRLASQIGSGLCGVLYVLDEPSIGLHQSDNAKLIETLRNLRDLGNTVIVVEHDEETMHSADYIVDVGPRAGIHGGNIIAYGTIEEIKAHKDSITGQYLSGDKKIEIPKKLRKGNGKSISLKGARRNNLKNVNIDIPLGCFVSITGVSGSGKSSLIIHTLFPNAQAKIEGNHSLCTEDFDELKGLEYVDKIIDIDQSPIGRTPRSNPATYTGAFGPIRDWFVALPEAKARGYKPGRFSFNVKGGRCETCQGDGMLKIEMHFLPDVYVKCEECHGQRYNKETLEIRYKDKSIADVLKMTVDDSCEFFDKVPSIRDKLKALKEVGLGYVELGQSATTLSGGEAQRVKLAKELSRRSTGRTLYILDEPTTGLHADDTNKLLSVLHQLVDMGNTVLVIEHNLDVIKTSDYIIDVGPYGGDKGGSIVATGAPQDIIAEKTSLTGKYLKNYF